MNSKQDLLDSMNDAILRINALWPKLNPDINDEAQKRTKLLARRTELQRQYDELADDILYDGTDELNNAIEALNEASNKAKEAIEAISDDVNRITKISETISKAAKAVAAVASIIAMF